MNIQEIKNKIQSINYYENIYVKNCTHNICNIMLKSNIIAKNKKVEIQKIKINIEEINDPWLWNYKPNYNNLTRWVQIIKLKNKPHRNKEKRVKWTNSWSNIAMIY